MSGKKLTPKGSVSRPARRIELEHSYDRGLRDKRMECYQGLFRVTECLPRYWLPAETPTRHDLYRFRKSFHDWYFGEEAGGMFLTPSAKDAYIRLVNALAEMMDKADGEPERSELPLLSPIESQILRELASELRHQLAEDVGSANPPRLRWTRLGRTSPPPLNVGD